MIAVIKMGNRTLVRSLPEVIEKNPGRMEPFIIEDPTTNKEYVIKFTYNQTGHCYEANIKEDERIFAILKEFGWYHKI